MTRVSGVLGQKSGYDRLFTKIQCKQMHNGFDRVLTLVKYCRVSHCLSSLHSFI